MAAEQTGATALDIVTLIIAVIGAFTGIGALAWGIAQHQLSGVRTKVDLVGGWLLSGGMVISGPIRTVSAHTDQPQGLPVVGVRINNVGRLPVSVTQWSVRVGSTRMQSTSFYGNPDLPFRLEVGSEQTWYIEAERVVTAARAVESAFDEGSSLGASAGLGNGKTVTSAERVESGVLRRLFEVA